MTTWTAPSVTSKSWATVAPATYRRVPVVYSAALEPVMYGALRVVLHVTTKQNWATPSPSSPDWSAPNG